MNFYECAFIAGCVTGAFLFALNAFISNPRENVGDDHADCGGFKVPTDLDFPLHVDGE